MWDFKKMVTFMTFKEARKEILEDHIEQDNNGMEKDEPNEKVSMKSVLKHLNAAFESQNSYKSRQRL